MRAAHRRHGPASGSRATPCSTATKTSLATRHRLRLLAPPGQPGEEVTSPVANRAADHEVGWMSAAAPSLVQLPGREAGEGCGLANGEEIIGVRHGCSPLAAGEREKTLPEPPGGGLTPELNGMDRTQRDVTFTFFCRAGGPVPLRRPVVHA